MSGVLYASSASGPGRPNWSTPEAAIALAHATDLVGYGPYLERVAARPPASAASPATTASSSSARAHALQLAAAGRRVAVVSGGDPGVFAMAAAVFEAIEQGAGGMARARHQVVPGISAMQAAAARLGAPLGQRFLRDLAVRQSEALGS